MSEPTFSQPEIKGVCTGTDFLTRRPLHIRENKIAAVLAISPSGPTRLLFIGGGHVDVCGSAIEWIARIRMCELEARET